MALLSESMEMERRRDARRASAAAAAWPRDPLSDALVCELARLPTLSRRAGARMLSRYSSESARFSRRAAAYGAEKGADAETEAETVAESVAEVEEEDIGLRAGFGGCRIVLLLLPGKAGTQSSYCTAAVFIRGEGERRRETR